MDDLIPTILFAMLFAVGSWGITNTIWKQSTVDRGLAIYCPMGGQWAWNGECGK